MSIQLQRKKAQAELARVVAARMEMEVKVEELTEALTRLQRDIDIQKSKEQELGLKLDEFGRENT